MEKIAIISDIHGNLEALKSVLLDVENRGINRIICLGDIIAKGIHPSECLQLVKENCETILQGNCDEYFSKETTLFKIDEIERTRIQWNKNMVSADDQDFLLKLPFSYEFYISGSLIRLFHASPTSNSSFIANLDSLDKKIKMFYPSSKTLSNEIADIVIYGHIHTQYLDRIYNKTLINAGSVGNEIDIIRNPEKDGKNEETTNAFYVILEGNYKSKEYAPLNIQLVRVPYDIDKELNSKINGNINIEKDSYEMELREGKYRDMEKIYKSFESRGIDKTKI